jgi:hypothetical protein
VGATDIGEGCRGRAVGRCGSAPEIGFGVAFSCGFPCDGGQGSGAGIGAGPGTAVLTWLLCGCPACRLCRREGDPLVKFTKQPQAKFQIGAKG